MRRLAATWRTLSVQRRTALALCLLLLLAAGVTLRLKPTPRTAPGACTHWASPQGSGSTCTREAPCLVASWWPLAGPGTTLCLLDGTYRGSPSLIGATAQVTGTQAAPVRVRAEHDGAVLLDGQDSGVPINLEGRYVEVQGLNVRRGGNAPNVSLKGDHNTVRRVVSWDVGPTSTAHNVALSGTNGLLEDSAGFGTAEKQLAVGSAKSGDSGNVVRRFFGLWQDAGDSKSPTNTGEQGYGQSRVTFENLVLTWDRTGAASGQSEGILQAFRSNNSQILGSIFYVTGAAQFDPGQLFFANSDGGSGQGSGNYQPSSGNLFTHLVGFIAPSHPRFAEVRAFRLNYQGPGPHGSNNTVRGLVSVSGQPMQCTAPDWTCSQVQQGTSLEVAIGEGTSVWTDSVAAPGICQRYVGGTLTQEPLWPWPMNQRIRDATAQAGLAPVDVTQTVEALLGRVPDVCRSDRTPQPPVPPTPGGPLVLLCEGALRDQGNMEMRCVQQVEGRR